MSKTDIHKEAFDEGTKAKLELLRLYLREWLPVFVSNQKVNYENIEIYDFFAGEGQDSINTLGSPLIILDEVKAYCSELVRKKAKLSILFNDADNAKFLKLNNSKDRFLLECSQNKRFGFCKVDDTLPKCPFKLKIENSDLAQLFANLKSDFNSNPRIPRFMFIDQYGIKQVTKEVFQELTSLIKTDFLFFISSFLHLFKFIPTSKKC